ncbi:hypothetical protein ET464_16815 [Paenibacillus protaetiae]|uniref:Uncharacterized protein n=2 Tax=Paenibacillus protaetiae TaxID=2509456 RepID=A0A4P6EYS5_9BACL|nr:hypothetical protein ET464_16815 [Paenibacillus protaetiae]
MQPVGSNAAQSLSQVNKDLAAAKKQIQDAQKAADAAAKKQDQVKGQKVDAKQAIMQIQTELTAVNDNLNALTDQIATKEEEYKQTSAELDEANERVAERDDLIKNRMRLMYSNGFVSYLDVLLSSTSFSDFLDRFDTLKSMLKQDRDILEQNKKDKATVEQKKQQKSEQLNEVKTLYTKQATYKSQLSQKEQQKEVLIASLDDQLEELEDITEEQQQQLVDLATKVSKLESEKKKLSSVAKPYTGGKLGMPIVDYTRISSPFGYRTHPVTGEKEKLHTGIDFAAPKGTDIFAAESGVVLLAQPVSGYGNAIIIDHGHNLWTLYGHIRDGGTKVKQGDTVKKGQKIAEVGMTGTATGYHLHFEVRVNGNPVNPSSYLK